MTALEFKRKKGWFQKEYAVGCTIAARTLEELANEMRQFKATVLDHDRKRGSALVEFRLTLVAPATEHAEMEAYIRKVYQDEVELCAFLRKRPFILSILTPGGRLHKEFPMT